VQEAALGAARPGGALVLVGLSPMGSATNFPAALLAREEKSVIGSYYGSVFPRRDFPRFLEWYEAGRLPIDRMVSRAWPLEAINEAYAEMLGGEGARGVIVFS
jgi:Zn-dependent alcohol dehydrogenase